MINKKEIFDVLDRKIKGIQNAISSAITARDMAPSAMESHSDTTRSEKEKLIYALESELNNLNKIKEKDLVLKIYHIQVGDNLMRVCLVPEGLGGETVGDLKLISEFSPLGKLIKMKNVGDEFNFNNKKIMIENIEC